jgi:tripartite-type tricarboxylate transporter receptor subunit TctC
VPFAAGSGIDATARTISDELGKRLKQPVIVDYKPGANGAIAASAVARAAPDGYTIFMTTVSTHSANPHLLKSIPYDPTKDFASVSRVGNLPFMPARHCAGSPRSISCMCRIVRHRRPSRI